MEPQKDQWVVWADLDPDTFLRVWNLGIRLGEIGDSIYGGVQAKIAKGRKS
jgi:hypothetical protein